MKNIFLLSNSFPYGNWETYLETEVKYYDKFDSVQIFSLSIRKNQKNILRQLEIPNCHVHPIFYRSSIFYILFFLKAVWDRNYFLELVKLIKAKRLTFKRIVRLTAYFSRSHYEAGCIKKALKEEGLLYSQEQGVIYSYRLDYQPYVALLIKKYLPQCVVVARGHRYDLYEYANRDNYLPLREVILKNVDRIFLISDDGKRYLDYLFPSYADKILVSKIGSFNYGVKNVIKQKNSISIVSCSNIVPVKRIDRIIEALSNIKNSHVEWTHYGEGVLLNEMLEQVNKLPPNIHVAFKGFVANKELMLAYLENDYHLFLNVSESEGIPVSIMEAISFGIPVIATDVGGTREIVSDGLNGVLLSSNYKTNELSEMILKFIDMEDEQYQYYRAQAREIWLSEYNADINYNKFISELINLL